MGTWAPPVYFAQLLFFVYTPVPVGYLFERNLVRINTWLHKIGGDLFEGFQLEIARKLVYSPRIIIHFAQQSKLNRYPEDRE